MALVRRALAVLFPRWRQPGQCEACGCDFTCGATLTGCWCLKVELTRDARAQLRERYKKCICRHCLERAGAVAQRDPLQIDSAAEKLR